MAWTRWGQPGTDLLICFLAGCVAHGFPLPCCGLLGYPTHLAPSNRPFRLYLYLLTFTGKKMIWTRAYLHIHASHSRARRLGSFHLRMIGPPDHPSLHHQGIASRHRSRVVFSNHSAILEFHRSSRNSSDPSRKGNYTSSSPVRAVQIFLRTLPN